MPPTVFVVLGFAIAWMLGWAIFYHWRIRRLDIIDSRFEESLRARHQDEPRYRWLMERTSEFMQLMRGADVEDTMVPYARPVSPMHVETGHGSAMANWLALQDDCYQWTRRAIIQARGTYKDRRAQSLNPLHWAVALTTLPMQAVKWIGGNPDGSLSRGLTVLWWLVGAAALVAGLIGLNLLDLIERE